jgi:hypothetical protein
VRVVGQEPFRLGRLDGATVDPLVRGAPGALDQLGAVGEVDG